MDQNQPIIVVNNSATIDQTLDALFQGTTNQFLANLASQELYDYTPLEDALRRLNTLIHYLFAEPPLLPDGNLDKTRSGQFSNWQHRVQVVPRGSFASRTAIKATADLDLDVIFPDDFQIKKPEERADVLHQLKYILNMDASFEAILFDQGRLQVVLGFVWARITDGGYARDLLKGFQGQMPTNWWTDGWLSARRQPHEFTRSIPARTTINVNQNLEIDLFVKVRSQVRGQDVILGVDRDGPDGQKRLSTVTFIPTPGVWYGDRILGPVDRTALLVLKWWKTSSNIPVKSHHLLGSLNALHELDPKDPLYEPEKTSASFSLRRVLTVMEKILRYLDNQYRTPCLFLLGRNIGGQVVNDYPFPQFCLGQSDTMFLQFMQEVKWNGYQQFMASKVLLNFADRIRLVLSKN